MSWTDRIAFENILQLKRDFKIKTAVVTGTGKGGDAELYGHYFEEVYTIEKDYETFLIARDRLSYLKNVKHYWLDSAEFLRQFRWIADGTVLLYLDAHYYDPTLEQKWVVIRELQALKGFKNCVIVVHDYDNGKFGHLVYAGEHLNWKVIGEHIQKVNPDFNYYVNDVTDIYNENTVRKLPIHVDEYIIDNIQYANSSEVKRQRGILFATPKPLDLNKYKLIEGR